MRKIFRDNKVSAKFKDPAYRILVFIFVANFFFEENHLFLYKRIIYSIFIYLATYEIFIFYVRPLSNAGIVKMPSYYRSYLALFSLFIIINIITDFLNPAFNLITLINNPLALLSVVPVFIFFLGTRSPDLENILALLTIVCSVFLFVWVIKLPGRIPYYEGIVCSSAIIPLFIISDYLKKTRLFALALIFLAIPFSMVSDQRIILLKILVFFSLFISLRMVKNNSLLKVLIMLAGCFIIF